MYKTLNDIKVNSKLVYNNNTFIIVNYYFCVIKQTGR